MNLKLPIIDGTKTEIDHPLCGYLIRDARKAVGLFAKDLADGMGIRVSYMCALETGNRKWTEEKFKCAVKVINDRKNQLSRRETKKTK